jgi:hypothetical protein
MTKSLLTLVFLFAATGAAAQSDYEKSRATEAYAPVPKAVSLNNGVPSDAVVLFGGTDLDKWEAVKGGAAGWTVADGAAEVKAGAGDIRTKDVFCDVQLHIEWQTPTLVTDKAGKPLEGQARNNSGVFLQERYEVQVLDSYRADTYTNGQAGSIYKQSAPLVNATKAPGEWQAYDIIYSAPKFDGQKLIAPARITVLHNGVVIQNNFEIKGPTAWIGRPPYEAHGCAPIKLQDHGNAVKFRNIWVRGL